MTGSENNRHPRGKDIIQMMLKIKKGGSECVPVQARVTSELYGNQLSTNIAVCHVIRNMPLEFSGEYPPMTGGFNAYANLSMVFSVAERQLGDSGFNFRREIAERFQHHQFSVRSVNTNSDPKFSNSPMFYFFIRNLPIAAPLWSSNIPQSCLLFTALPVRIRLP
jgi:hypothetical protein